MLRLFLSLMNNLKKRRYKARAKSICATYEEPLTVNAPCKFSKRTHLGRNTHFNGLNIRGKGEVRIGDNFHSGSKCVFMTENHNYEGEAIPYDHTYIRKNITIEDNVWLGYRVTVLGGVTIGEGAIIQACSVVVKDIPKYAIAGGYPAKVFAYRDIPHYEKLKM